MRGNRLLVLAGAGLMAASGAWADGVAYVDCTSHPEETQVFAKPRRTPEAVAAIPCGERFTILLNGFIFSRVQTRDGQVGYVYSNVITIDRSGAGVGAPSATRLTSASAAAPAAPAKAAEPKPTVALTPAAPAQVQAAPVQQASSSQQSSPQQSNSQLEAARSTVNTGAANTASSAAAPANVESSAASTPITGISPKLSERTVAAQPEATPAASTSEPTAAQPEPATAEPAAPAIRPVAAKESWERPNAGGRRNLPLIELFGGYSFARFNAGGGVAATNLHGALGSFGYNLKPWLQVVADSSYNVVTVAGTKNVLYGNHWGPRIFWRGRGRWSMTPFVEALAGGSRADTSISGVAGYSTSQNCFSYKVGGGFDIKPSKRIMVRVIDVDYYGTSFGTNVHQSNYWASAGIVLRLLGRAE